MLRVIFKLIQYIIYREIPKKKIRRVIICSQGALGLALTSVNKCSLI